MNPSFLLLLAGLLLGCARGDLKERFCAQPRFDHLRSDCEMGVREETVPFTTVLSYDTFSMYGCALDRTCTDKANCPADVYSARFCEEALANPTNRLVAICIGSLTRKQLHSIDSVCYGEVCSSISISCPKPRSLPVLPMAPPTPSTPSARPSPTPSTPSARPENMTTAENQTIAESTAENQTVAESTDENATWVLSPLATRSTEEWMELVLAKASRLK